MKNEVNWIVHLVANTCCEECGKKESEFLKYACNAHTHGMEQYCHQDFQLVLLYSPEEVMRILNTMGLRVQSGECFKAGDYVEDIYEDCKVRLDEFEETGRKVLRVVIPDKFNIYPDDPKCMDVYRLQNLQTDALFQSTNNN